MKLACDSTRFEFKKYLFEVTPFSKSLALLIFIILPFLGGWVGYKWAPEKIVYTEVASIQPLAAQSDGYEDITKQYQSQYKTDRVLEFLFRTGSDMEIFFFQTVGPTSACCGVIGYNQNTNTFIETNAYAVKASGDEFSPQGNLIARFNDQNINGNSLEIYDIEANQVIKVITLNQPESLIANKCGYGGAYASLVWLDNQTISYGVYKELSQNSDTTCEMEFIEYRYEKVT